MALVVAFFVYRLARQRSAAPQIPFAHAEREDITSVLSTNGRVQPVEWSEVHAEVGGAVDKTFVQKGQQVAEGAALVQLDSREQAAEVASAEARVAQAESELQTLRQGGRTSDLATLESSVASARQEIAMAQRDYESLQRLQAKNAATAEDVRTAHDRVERAKVQLQGLETRRAGLVGRGDVASAESRLREAQAAVATARTHSSMSVIRSPLAGVVYQFDLRAGAYLRPGDLAAAIGKLDRVRVVLYVDEPDLGRVVVGRPVAITWDALPGRTWKGAVDKLPTQVTALGTRQVGEVSSVIENPDRDLLPGTNVNVEIRAETAKGAVVVPTGAIRRENGKVGVYVLADDKLQWRDVKTGVASASRTQIDGVREGEGVALPTERTLKPGMEAAAVYR